MISTPAVTYLPDTYRFAYQVEGIDIVLDRFTEGKEGLHVEVTVTTDREPAPGLLHHGRLNLSSAVSKASVVKVLRGRAAPGFLDDADFPAMIEQVCYRSLTRWRDGDPFINLREVDYRERPRWLLEPYIEYGGITVMFAKGGSGKSLFGLALAVSIATGVSLVGGVVAEKKPVLYLDWEADEYTHAERLAAICAGANIDVPDLLYRRGVASLAEGAPALRRAIGLHGIGFVVFDSIGAARGGDPISAELTIKLFAAVRSLTVPALGIDHITKNGDGPQANPFGSVYTTNLARVTWRMDTVQAEGSNEAAISLTNMKINNGRLARRRGYRAYYESDEDDRLVSARWDSSDMRAMPEFIGTISHRDQVISVLKAHGSSMHPASIVAALEQHGIDLKENAVRAVLSAGSKSGAKVRAAFVPDKSNPGAWGLASYREEREG